MHGGQDGDSMLLHSFFLVAVSNVGSTASSKYQSQHPRCCAQHKQATRPIIAVCRRRQACAASIALTWDHYIAHAPVHDVTWVRQQREDGVLHGSSSSSNNMAALMSTIWQM
jgi:hypothetical protein